MRRSTFESITVSLGQPMNQSISGTDENFDCGLTWLKCHVPNLMHKLLQYTLGSILSLVLQILLPFVLYSLSYITAHTSPRPPKKRVIKVKPTIKLNLYTLLI